MRLPPERVRTGLAVAAACVLTLATMGCGDECPVVPGKRYVDWDLQDPAGLPLDEVRRIRGDVARRVEALLAELSV